MHIHWLQHVPFEGLGIIDTWAAGYGHTMSATRFWQGDGLPAPDSMDMLVVMGGPMGVNDEADYPWLEQEKSFIRQAWITTSDVLPVPQSSVIDSNRSLSASIFARLPMIAR